MSAHRNGMRYLNRLVLRELAANRSRTLVLILALAVAFLMPAGMEMGLRSLLDTRNAFAQKHGLADLEVRMLPEDLRNLPDWSGIAGLDQVEERLLMPGIIENAGGQPVNALMVFLRRPQPTINRFELRQGRALSNGAAAEAIVERSAREFHGIDAGRELQVKVGNQTYTQRVVGVAASPEFLIVAANPEYFLPEKGSLAVVYTPLERVYENIGFRMVNDLIFRFAPYADAEATKTAILARLGNRQIERVIPRDEHISWKHITLDHNVFRIFQPALSLVLAILAAALVAVNFDRLVRKQYRELGAVKAMGYSGAAIVRAYVYASLCLAAAGIAVGAAGAIGFRSAFLLIYARAHALAHLEHHLYAPVLLQAALITVAIAVASALLATWRLWNANPVILMRPLLVQATGSGMSHRWDVLDRFPTPVRLGLKNLLRTPRLAALTVLGVASTVSVGVAYLICLDSMQQTIVRSFESDRWTSAVSFLYPVLGEEYESAAAAIPGIRAEGFVRAQAMVANGTETIEVSLAGLQPQGSLRTVNVVAGRMPRAANEILIGADLSRRLDVAEGSPLELRVRNQRHQVVVVGIKSDVVLSEVVMALPAVQTLLEIEEQATGMFVAIPDAADAAAVTAQLRQLDFVGRVTKRTTLVAEFTAILQDIRKLVLLVAVIALLVAIVFITANLNMAIAEQATEFSTLWALGYNRAAATQIVAVNSAAQAILALAIAVPLTGVLAVFLNALASRAWFDQATYVSPLLAPLAGGGVMLLTIGGTIVTFRRFWRTDLLENLRTRSIQ
uniref:Uncharacterized protein n=1 Tax=uncultured Acidobacteria bacterium A3 TaxID=1036853 RepID=F8TTH6_9BACT|nr:hypothetical protein [uncultured Acidobacteria bacterium A3]